MGSIGAAGAVGQAQRRGSRCCWSAQRAKAAGAVDQAQCRGGSCCLSGAAQRRQVLLVSAAQRRQVLLIKRSAEAAVAGYQAQRRGGKCSELEERHGEMCQLYTVQSFAG